MEFRPLQKSDIDDITTLAQRCFPYDSLPSNYLYERIWGDPDTENELLLGIWQHERLAAFSIGVIRAVKGVLRGYIKLFATHPDMRGQGFGTALLTRMEAELARRGVEEVCIGGSAPWYVFAGVDVRYTPAFLMLQKAGYKHIGDAVNLLVDLQSLPEAKLELLQKPQQLGYVLRRMTPSDVGLFLEWARKTWGMNWTIEGLMALNQTPVSAFLALQSDAIVGFAAYDSARPSWFGPMGTEAHLRRQGIGGALYLLCLEDMRRKGYAHVEVSWAGPVSFYSRLSGAYIHRVFRRMQKSLGAKAEGS